MLVESLASISRLQTSATRIGLHELLGLAALALAPAEQAEEGPPLLAVEQLDDALFLVELHVGERAGGDVDEGVLAPACTTPTMSRAPS